MSDTKHTPGPWKVDEVGPLGVIQDDEDGRGICDIHAPSEDFMEEYKANARLIAVSPELLEAAEAAFRTLSEFADPDAVNVDWGYIAENSQAQAENLKAVIAKVKGE